MDRVKTVLHNKLSPRSFVIDRERYSPTWDGDIDEEDGRKSSSSEAVEEKGLLFPSITKKRSSGFSESLPFFIRSISVVQLIVTLLLLFTSIISILYFIDLTMASRVEVKAATQGAKHSHQNLIAFKKPCGDSAEEARARGCRFDVMGFLWLPEQCIDQELIDEFVALHDWEFYTDKNKTTLVPIEEAMKGEYPILYVSHEYHVRHCTLIWRKMHRALLSSDGLAAMDGYMGNYAHTLHCEHMLLEWRDRPFPLINTGLVRQFPSCGLVGK